MHKLVASSILILVLSVGILGQAKATEVEIAKLGEQAKRDVENAGKTAKHELRNYAAETAVRLAEEIIRREMRPEDDARLIQRNVQELGGAPQ